MGRPTKQLISREGAAHAALDVIDEVGIDAFSLGAVARRMGVKAPSLYYYFADKAELLAEVARMILTKASSQVPPSASWEEKTLTTCIVTRRALLEHPKAAPLILQFFPRHILLEYYEDAIGSFPGPSELHLAILEGIEKLTFGSALFAAAASADSKHSMPSFDASQYPNLNHAMNCNGRDEEEDFILTLEMFIAGVKLVSQKRRDENDNVPAKIAAR